MTDTNSGLQRCFPHPPLLPDTRAPTLNPDAILRLSSPPRYPSSSQWRWFWRWLLYTAFAWTYSMHLHFDHSSLELHQPGASGHQNHIVFDFRARSGDNRGILVGQQLPPLPQWKIDVDAQWQHWVLEPRKAGCRDGRRREVVQRRPG